MNFAHLFVFVILLALWESSVEVSSKEIPRECKVCGQYQDVEECSDILKSLFKIHSLNKKIDDECLDFFVLESNQELFSLVLQLQNSSGIKLNADTSDFRKERGETLGNTIRDMTKTVASIGFFAMAYQAKSICLGFLTSNDPWVVACGVGAPACYLGDKMFDIIMCDVFVPGFSAAVGHKLGETLGEKIGHLGAIYIIGSADGYTHYRFSKKT